jgi:UDP-N-acetylmuramate: L-alanyl-gamma-D-glutamyl-meso-diaminopimelate ligase
MRDHAIPDASEGTPLAPQPVWLATDVAFEPGGTRFTVTRGGEPLGEVRTPLLGAFNVQNALAAIAAATAVGVGWDAIAAGLASFRSVKRRMELRGTVGGVEIVDDFAHHPTAVRGTVAAVRARVRDGGRVIAIFEPRSYTAQRREFQEAFRDALSGADRVILAGLHHPERYDRETGMDPEELVAALRAGGVPADYEPEVEAIVRLVASEAASGDVVLVMSNGGFEGIHEKLLRAVDPRAPGPVNP